MPTTTKNRRGQVRYAIPEESQASVEFERGGRTHRLAVVNLSASGLSFVFDDDARLPGMEEGADLGPAVVRVGDCELRGEMLAMHVTTDSGSRYVCGALFYPATDTDLVKLKGVIAGIEVAGTD